MIKYTLELKQAIKTIKKLKSPERSRVFSSLDIISENPSVGKSLIGPLNGKFSYRVGKSRIIYTIENDILVVFIIDIGLRKNIFD